MSGPRRPWVAGAARVLLRAPSPQSRGLPALSPALPWRRRGSQRLPSPVFSRRACRPRLAENWDDNVHKCGYSLNVAYLDGDKKAAALVPKMFTSGMSYRQAKNAAKARK